MKDRKLRCNKCDHTFEVKNVITPDDTGDGHIQRTPIRCPRCGSTDVKLA